MMPLLTVCGRLLFVLPMGLFAWVVRSRPCRPLSAGKSWHGHRDGNARGANPGYGEPRR
jgi:hypothetical protein